MLVFLTPWLFLLDLGLCLPVREVASTRQSNLQNQSELFTNKWQTVPNSSKNKSLMVAKLDPSPINGKTFSFGAEIIKNYSLERGKRSINASSTGFIDNNLAEDVFSSSLLQDYPELSEVAKTVTSDDFDHIRKRLLRFSERSQITPHQATSASAGKLSRHGAEEASPFHVPLVNGGAHGAPQYMLDLFDRFQNNPLSQPASNIVRSFFNQANASDQQAYTESYKACTKKLGFEACPRIHHLTFDISSVPKYERVTMAELRLYKIVERDRRKYIGSDRKVEVVELIRTTKHGVAGNENQSIVHRKVLDSKHIIGRSSGWETFFITGAIRRWVKSKSPIIHELEVYIENISGGSKDNSMEFEQTSKTTNEPLLVVFSDDTSKRHRLERKEELAELLNHVGNLKHNDVPGIDNSEIHGDGVSSGKQRDDFTAEEDRILSRKKRSSNEPCHLERMYVNFGEIGYDWVINPSGYAAGHCVGTCDFPYFKTNMSPHTVIQSWMHNNRPSEYEKPCCVPVKLGPISMLYFEKNALTFKYKYEGMRVLECGCR